MRNPVQCFKQFAQKQDGNVLFLVGAAIFAILVSSGGAIDLSRYLIARTQAQAALDNAILAAAAVRDTQDSTEVANRFFAANYPSSIGVADTVNVSESEDGAVITGTVYVAVNALFGAFVGINDYNFTVLSEAVINGAAGLGAEVVLTLDNSPSMCMSSPFGGSPVPDPSCRKLNAIKQAATRFVDELVTDETKDNVFVGLVPFNHNVRHGISAAPHPLLGPSARTDGGPTYYLSPIIDLTNDHDTLVNSINSMSVVQPSWGFTRTNVGTIMAGLMLMPYPEDTAHFNHAAGLPREFNPARLDKVLVLMTDGENVVHYQPPARPSFIPQITTVDNQHQATLCDELRNNYGIIIYSVTYDLPDGPVKDIYRNCATNQQFYFDVQNTNDLVFAYETIAQSIKRVRLHR